MKKDLLPGLDAAFAKRRRSFYTLLSFFLPLVLLVITLYCMGVTPFGEHNLAISDGRYYLNGLVNFGRMLRGEENLLYSFRNGLGGNNWSVLAWGGFCPVLPLSLLATPENAPFVLTWVIVISFALCGLSMYLLLSELRGHRGDSLLLSTSYAFIGFNVAYCFHYYFLVGVQLLPLMILGLRRLLHGRSPLLYVCSLALCIFCSFYFGFMLCAASVIYFLVWHYVRQERLFGRRLHFQR